MALGRLRYLDSHGKALFQNEQKIVVAGVGRKELNSEGFWDDKILPYCISNFLSVVPDAFKIQLKRESAHFGSQFKVHPDFKAWQESKNVRQPVTSYHHLHTKERGQEVDPSYKTSRPT